MMPWLYSTSCPLTEYISVVTKERQICLPQSTPSQPPNPPTPPCIALRRPPLGVTLATALNAHSTLRTCVQKSPPNFWGRRWDKNLVTPAQDPLSMSDLNLHPRPPPLGVLLVEMRGCPTTFGIGRGAGGFDANRGGINAGSGYSNWWCWEIWRHHHHHVFSFGLCLLFCCSFHQPSLGNT